ncbi:MAG: hypothetical protein DGJ47_001158 [Rickettsiaceae bacterium]
MECIVNSPSLGWDYDRLLFILQQDLLEDQLIKHIDLIFNVSCTHNHYDIIEFLLNKYESLRNNIVN